MGRFLAEAGPPPDRVLCSSSVRTRQTWERVARALGREPELVVSEDLYLASAARMLSILREHGEDATCLLLVGHNPGTEELARTLAGSGDRDAWERMRAKFPTAALATLAFDAKRWPDVGPGAGELVRFVVPRELED